MGSFCPVNVNVMATARDVFTAKVIYHFTISFHWPETVSKAWVITFARDHFSVFIILLFNIPKHFSPLQKCSCFTKCHRVAFALNESRSKTAALTACHKRTYVFCRVIRTGSEVIFSSFPKQSGGIEEFIEPLPGIGFQTEIYISSIQLTVCEVTSLKTSHTSQIWWLVCHAAVALTYWHQCVKCSK